MTDNIKAKVREAMTYAMDVCAESPDDPNDKAYWKLHEALALLAERDTPIINARQLIDWLMARAELAERQYREGVSHYDLANIQLGESFDAMLARHEAERKALG